MALVPVNENGPFALFSKNSRELEVNGQKIIIRQDWHGTGVAAVVWDASLVLSIFLCKYVGEKLKGKRVIELGAGTGVAGITAARLGAYTVFTDKEDFLHVTRENVINNLHNNETYLIRALEWGKNLTNWEMESPSWDYVIGADIIYIEETFNDLLRTLKCLTLTRQTVILLSCRIRYDRDQRFLDMMKEDFDLSLVHFDKEKDIRVFEAVKKEVGETKKEL